MEAFSIFCQHGNLKEEITKLWILKISRFLFRLPFSFSFSGRLIATSPMSFARVQCANAWIKASDELYWAFSVILCRFECPFSLLKYFNFLGSFTISQHFNLKIIEILWFWFGCLFDLYLCTPQHRKCLNFLSKRAATPPSRWKISRGKWKFFPLFTFSLFSFKVEEMKLMFMIAKYESLNGVSVSGRKKFLPRGNRERL